MKNEQLKKLIKEEIKSILENPNTVDNFQYDKFGTPNNADVKIPPRSPNSPDPKKLNPGDFNVEITALLRNLKINKSNMDAKELKNVIDILTKIAVKAREGNLTQNIEDRVMKALMLKTRPNPEA
jgi:hypothetical protein